MHTPLNAATPFANWLWRLSILIACLIFYVSPTRGLISPFNDATHRRPGPEKQHVFTEPQSKPDHELAGKINTATKSSASQKHYDTLSAMLSALDVMQEQYFEVWQGTWPTAIDWTSAVLGTHVSAALSSLSMSFDYIVTPESTLSTTEKANENLINRYFSQLVAAYFGQDAFRLRNEAYDDMLWVVLGWLDSIKFIELHSDLHYKEPQRPARDGNSKYSSWYGKQWIPSFAHRARLFWDLASEGWDTSLCGGGMIWSPYLAPYKNAITNELFITASISMYLYFPGDDNPSPFIPTGGPLVGTRDPKYLAAAIEGYKWLKLSNMTNERGLYVDGFHISGWERNPRNGTKKHTKCDSRNDMVYSYNQGVLLSGQRGLWEATGATSYLEEGHKLISNVINATGYDLKHDRPYKDGKNGKHPTLDLGEWYGIGRSGILEDVCDAHGYCSQDAQIFKGIFFHHLTLFCASLPLHYSAPGMVFDVQHFRDLKSWHDDSCTRYSGWIRRNADAAVATRNDDGKYGMWWGASRGNFSRVNEPKSELPDQAVDYRNHGTPRDRIWQDRGSHWESLLRDVSGLRRDTVSPLEARDVRPNDANDRYRGRTVETQSGGLAVLRALWDIVDLRALQEEM